MTELYAFVSTKTCPGQIPAYLEYTETDRVHLFHIWIDKSIPLAELHPRFRLWAMGGKYDFDHEESLDVIRSRVYEPRYEGIDLVLQRVGINHYDAWEIFKSYHGRHTMDDLEVKLIKRTE